MSQSVFEPRTHCLFVISKHSRPLNHQAFIPLQFLEIKYVDFCLAANTTSQLTTSLNTEQHSDDDYHLVIGKHFFLYLSSFFNIN